MNKENSYLSFNQVVFILVVSWLYTFFTYYIPFEQAKYSLCEIYSFQGIPFSLLLGVVLNYYSKKNPKKKP